MKIMAYTIEIHQAPHMKALTTDERLQLQGAMMELVSPESIRDWFRNHNTNVSKKILVRRTP